VRGQVQRQLPLLQAAHIEERKDHVLQPLHQPRAFGEVPTLPGIEPAPRLLAFNRPLAEDLGFDPAIVEPLAAEMFSGNSLARDAAPIALAYAGHQFGHFVPSLGDGRALLLGEIVDPRGRRRDVQLKGAGPTPFSRRGDGRAALGPVLREYVVSEAMHALGIPTTRSLAAVATGEVVHRDGPLPGAVLTRVAASHLRVGTFQYFAARGDVEALALLLDHAIGRHDPDLVGAERPALAFLEAVASREDVEKAHLRASKNRDRALEQFPPTVQSKNEGVLLWKGEYVPVGLRPP
jgi:uncharacterized protein YdiU (UPF0061 family)